MVISLVTHICTMRKEGSGTGNFKLKRSAAPFALSAPMPGTVRAQAYSPDSQFIPTAEDKGDNSTTSRQVAPGAPRRSLRRFLGYEPDSQKEPLRAGLSF